MANWKKVIVSGSQAELAAVTSSIALKVASNQQIGTTQATTFLTGSFTGSFKGDGSGLTGLGAGTVTSVAMTVPSFLSVAGSPITSTGTLAVTLSGTALPVLNGGTGVTTSTGTGDVVLSTSPTLTTPALGTPSSLVGTNITGTATNFTATTVTTNANLTGDVTSVGNATSIASGVIVDADINSSAAIAYSKLAVLTSANIILGNNSNVATSTTVSGDITINNTGVTAIGAGVIVNADIAASTIDLTAKVTGTLPVANGGTGITSLGTGISTFLGTPSSANLASAVTDETGTGALVFATSPTLVTPVLGVATGTSLVLSGDLTVQGTASFQNTTNLEVADRFVLFASGSNTTGDGGIIVQQGTQNVGELYGYENTANRWGFTSSFNASNASFTSVAYVTTTEFASANPLADPLYGGSSYGYGNIHVNSSTGDIFIYS